MISRFLMSVVPFLLLGLLYCNTWVSYLQHMPHLVSWSLGALLGLGLTGIVHTFFGPRKRPIERGTILNNLRTFGMATIIWMVLLLLFKLMISIMGLLIQIPAPWDIYLPFGFATFPFLALVYGLLFGKYRYQLEKVIIHFPNLPSTFDGYKILHISDIHSGTWDSLKGVQKGIHLINEQDADVLLFTGDLVNADKDEIDPFIPLFASLQPKDGKYAVLGNHDYYGQPRERSQRSAYYDAFFKKYKEMGFDLILNDHRRLEKGGEFINLVGVENWGSGRYFPKRGDLDQATAGISNNPFTILMSHDPSHWDLKVKPHPYRFDLTLSGHTHGMQFGINLPFFKWSPVQYRYKQWMGLYESAGQYLYVNRGFGMLAYAGRVGMSAEVTLIELRREDYS